MTEPVEQVAGSGEDVEEDCAILVVAEDFLLFIASGRNVINRSGEFDA